MQLHLTYGKSELWANEWIQIALDFSQSARKEKGPKLGKPQKSFFSFLPLFLIPQKKTWGPFPLLRKKEKQTEEKVLQI